RDRAGHRLVHRLRIQSLQSDHTGLGQLQRSEPDRTALDSDLRHSGAAARVSERGHREQPLHRWRRLAVAVQQSRPYLVDPLADLLTSQLAIRFQPQSLARYIVVRYVRVHRQVDTYLGGCLRSTGPTALGAVAELLPRVAHLTDVEVEADTGDVARLFSAED